MKAVRCSFIHLVVLTCIFGHAQQPPEIKFTDTAVIPFFHKVDPALTNFATILRSPVDNQYELLCVVGSTFRLHWHAPNQVPWYSGMSLGLFLEERSVNRTCHELLILKGSDDDAAETIEPLWAGPTEMVLRRTGSYGGPIEHLKFTFDLRTKKLTGQMKFGPFPATQVVYGHGTPLFVFEDAGKPLVLQTQAYDRPGFTVIAGAKAKELVQSYAGTSASPWPERRKAVRFGARDRFALGEQLPADLESIRTWSTITERSGSGLLLHPLPQSTYNQFAVKRPRRVEDGYGPARTTIAEEIGPNQIVGDRLWFGKHFYDGEGTTGVGGFGYFDTVSGKYVLFSPPEIIDWSVDALLSEGNDLWLALGEFTEGYGRSGGLLRWNISTGQARRFETGCRVHQIIRHGNRLFLATDLGVAILENGNLQLYAINKTSDGTYKTVLVNRPTITSR